jgi:DNA uptake protein ComE-like DNA-binding protein
MRHGKGKPPKRQHQRQHQQQRPQQPPPPPKYVDLNSAAVSEIADLPGVTVQTAAVIVGRRPIRGWDDLRGLPGVSEGLIKQLRTVGARIAPMVRPPEGS